MTPFVVTCGCARCMHCFLSVLLCLCVFCFLMSTALMSIYGSGMGARISQDNKLNLDHCLHLGLSHVHAWTTELNGFQLTCDLFFLSTCFHHLLHATTPESQTRCADAHQPTTASDVEPSTQCKPRAVTSRS